MIKMENINLITKIVNDIEQIKYSLENIQIKRWLSAKETAHYLSFSQDKIYKMLDTVLVEGEHFYRRQNRLIFDRKALDNYIISGDLKNDINVKEIIKDVLEKSQ